MTLLDPQCRMTNDDSSGRWGQLKLKIGKINLSTQNATWATGSLQLHRYCNHQTHVIQNSGLTTRAWCNASCFYTVHKHTPNSAQLKIGSVYLITVKGENQRSQGMVPQSQTFL